MEIGLLGYISENLQRMQKYGFKPVGFVDIKNRFVFKVEKEGKLYAAKFASPFQRPNLFRQLWHDNALSQTDGSVENPLFNKKGEVSSYWTNLLNEFKDEPSRCLERSNYQSENEFTALLDLMQIPRLVKPKARIGDYNNSDTIIGIQEYLDGIVMRPNQNLTIDQKRLLVETITSIHEKGWSINDICRSNVIISEGKPYLFDLGAASKAEDKKDQLTSHDFRDLELLCE